MPSTVAPGPGPDESARPRVATPTDVSAAIAARRRREERRRRVTVAAVAAALAVALLLAWLVRFSQVFAARTVEVRGVQRISSAQVVQAAAVPMGTPLVGLDSRAVAQRVAGALAPVGTVHVHTRLPHTVVIDVTERTPVFQRRAGSAWQLVDRDGVVFAVMAKQQPKLAVAVTQGVDNRLLSGVATVVTALPEAVRSRVVEVQAATPDQIVLKLDKGQQVLWGSADSSAVKAQVVTVLLTQKATVFDVTSPATPATR